MVDRGYGFATVVSAAVVVRSSDTGLGFGCFH